jgi:predicted transposase/invertase (TIGR01784 family)
MGLGIDPKVDIAFKKVFGSAETDALLIDLLNAVVQPAKPITRVDLVLPHSTKDAPLEKQVVADIRARDQGNRQFHVEMQWQVPWFFRKRVLFSWASFHPQQLRAGEDYQTLRPTISVCFLNQVIFDDEADYHLVCRLVEAKRGLLFSDDLEIHLPELPKFTKSVAQLSDALDRWCYFLRPGADLDLAQLPASLDVPMIRRAMEVLTVFTQDEKERAAYEAHLTFQRDQSSLLREAKEAEGRGMQKGALIGQVRLCQRMLKQPQASETDLAALSPEALTELLGQLLKQVLPKGD